MTIGAFAILIASLVIAGIAAYYIITKFFKEPLTTIFLALTGLLLLAVLLWHVFPGMAGYRIF